MFKRTRYTLRAQRGGVHTGGAKKITARTSKALAPANEVASRYRASRAIKSFVQAIKTDAPAQALTNNKPDAKRKDDKRTMLQQNAEEQNAEEQKGAATPVATNPPPPQPLTAPSLPNIDPTKWTPKLKGTPYAFLLENTWRDTSANVYTVIEQQDNLFMLAMDAIYDKLGAKKDNDIDIMDKYSKYEQKETLTSYITDIINVVNGGPLNSQQTTKFDEVLNTKKEPLIHLLLNPLRVQNHFIYNLASFIKNLKENPIADFDETKAGLMAIRYDSLVKANTLNLTSTDLRDGPVITSTTSNVTSLLGTNKGDVKDLFWYKFLMFCHLRKTDLNETMLSVDEYIKYIQTFRLNDSFRINGKEDEYAKYPLLAAYVYLIYNPIKDEMKKRLSGLNFGDKDITNSTGLKFLHHLIYTIESLTPPAEQTSLPETGASTAITAGGNNTVVVSADEKKGQ
jgi:hypothetical protein